MTRTKTRKRKKPFLSQETSRALGATVAIGGLAATVAWPAVGPWAVGLAASVAALGIVPVVTMRPRFDARDGLRLGYGRTMETYLSDSDIYEDTRSLSDRVGDALARLQGEGSDPVHLDATALRAGVAINGRFTSGRTYLPLSLCRQVARSGGGVVQFDGMVDHMVFDRLQSAMHGREDDAFLIDLRDDGTLQSSIGTPTRTIDPFAGLSKPALGRMISTLSGVANDVFVSTPQGMLADAMAEEMLSGDAPGVSYERIRRLCGIEEIQVVASSSGSSRARRSAKDYLVSLDGYVEEKGARQSARTMESHAAASSRLIEHCDAILEAPGPIVGRDATVTMTDVVFGRRLLVISSPARLPHHVQCMRAALDAALSMPQSRSSLPFLIVEEELSAFHGPDATFDPIVDWSLLGRLDVYGVVSLDPSGTKASGSSRDVIHLVERPGATIVMGLDSPAYLPSGFAAMVHPLTVTQLGAGEAIMWQMGGIVKKLSIDYLPRIPAGRSRVSADVLVPPVVGAVS